MLKIQKFTAEWLFWDLGWVTFSICKDYTTTDERYIIRGSTLSGSCDGTFDVGLFSSHKDARIALSCFEPEEVFSLVCEKLNYTPHRKEKF